MIVKKILLLLFALAAAGNTYLKAQDAGSDAVYLKLTREYTLNSDGSMDYRFIKQQKLLTYRAFHNLYGETFVVTNTKQQKLVVNECNTIMDNGKKIKTPANAFNEVLPGYAANAPAFNDLREMVITHTGLERDAVINLDYTVHSMAGFYPFFMGEEILAEVEPVNELTVRVRVPQGTPLFYTTFNGKMEPGKSTEGNFQVYTWHLSHVAALSTDEFQPSGSEAAPRLSFSTLSDLQKGYDFLTSQEAFKSAATAMMQSFTAQVTASAKTPLEKALKMQDIIVTQLNLTNVPFKATGFRIRTPEKVWLGNYGTLPEKALLLTALLRQAGMDAVPVVITRASLFDDKVATLLNIEEFGVRFNSEESGPVFLSVSSLNSQNLAETMPGRLFIAISSGFPYSITKAESKLATTTIDGNLYFAAGNKMNGDLTVSFTEGFNPWFALTRDNSKVKQYIGGGIRSTDIKQVKSTSVTQSLTTATVTFQKDGALKKDSSFWFFTLPYATNGVESWGIKILPAERTAPLEIPFIANDRVSLSITLPDDMKLFTQETHVDLSNSVGSYRFEIKMEGGKILVTKEISFRKRIINPSDYSSFKVLMDNWNAPGSRQVIFQNR